MLCNALISLLTRSHLKKRVLVQVQGGPELQPAGILKYSEELKQGTNTEIGPKNFFEIASKKGAQSGKTRPPIVRTSSASKRHSRRPPEIATIDVDVIVKVATLARYHWFSNQLRQLGFIEDTSGGGIYLPLEIR